MELFRQFSEAAPANSGGLIEMLGIDWKMLIFQILAFLVMVWVLAKFVYPWLMKSVDERQTKINSGVKAMAEAQQAAASSEKHIAKMLADAKAEASDIVTTAKEESAAVINAAEEKSKKRAEQITADAQAQISKEILSAKKALHNETIELVAMATEKIIGKTASKGMDNDLIADAIKDVKK